MAAKVLDYSWKSFRGFIAKAVTNPSFEIQARVMDKWCEQLESLAAPTPDNLRVTFVQQNSLTLEFGSGNTFASIHVNKDGVSELLLVRNPMDHTRTKHPSIEQVSMAIEQVKPK